MQADQHAVYACRLDMAGDKCTKLQLLAGGNGDSVEGSLRGLDAALGSASGLHLSPDGSRLLVLVSGRPGAGA